VPKFLAEVRARIAATGERMADDIFISNFLAVTTEAVATVNLTWGRKAQVSGAVKIDRATPRPSGEATKTRDPKSYQ